MITLAALFEELRVPRDGVLYMHSSMDWIWRAGMGLDEVRDTLLGWLGDRGTLVMPTFPFVRGHEAYLRRGAHLDVRNTPALVGLLNELVRRLPGALRSLDPDLPVSALGPDASRIVGERPTGPDPKGPDSPFHRVLASGGTLVGLGVTTNYMSMTHVLDARFRHRYDFRLYSTETFEATVRDYVGRTHVLRKHAIPAALEKYIKPGKVIALLPEGTDIFRSVSIDGSSFFRWRLPGWEEICTRHIEEQLARGEVPCWHEMVAPRLRAEGGPA